MRYFLLIFCMILCSCSSKDEAEQLSPISRTSVESTSSDSFGPCSSSSAEPDPLILECPPEDMAECPVQDELPDDWMQTTPDGGCASKLKTSKDKLSFGAQGGVRCVTTDRDFGLVLSDKDCVVEDKYRWNDYKKMKCPWFTATKVSDYVLHISVNQNETGVERKLNVGVIYLYCGGSTLVTQSEE